MARLCNCRKLRGFSLCLAEPLHRARYLAAHRRHQCAAWLAVRSLPLLPPYQPQELQESRQARAAQLDLDRRQNRGCRRKCALGKGDSWRV